MKLLYNGKVFTENSVIENGYIIIKDNKIFEIGDMPYPENNYDEIYDANKCPIIPGFIDLQLNGGGGNLIMDADIEKTAAIADIHMRHGVTSFLGTTVAWTDEEQLNALRSGGEFIEKQKIGSRMLGMHMEGPFLNPIKAGAHYKEYLHEPDIKLLNDFFTTSGKNIKLITMAPELANSKEFIEHARKLGISLSIGHSLASYEQTIEALSNGMNMVTHVYNAMNGIVGRDPGVIMGLIDQKEAFGSIICDGVHVHPANLNLLKREMGVERLILVTDCAPIAGTEQKVWIQNGMKVYIKNYTGYREDGTLAGSVLTMEKAAKMAKIILNCTTSDVLKMGSYNPAKVINCLDRKGSLEVGKDADIVIVNNEDEFDPLYVFIEGNLEFKR